MANEYFVNRADLTAVADALRTKGETTDSLAFPGGFVTAIENISAGAALNFEIVGGTTQPNNPKENTIWVNTDTEITSWIISVKIPSNPIEGMIWILNGSSGAEGFNACEDTSIVVQVACAKQYIGGNWTAKQALIYQNGTWVAFTPYLYDKGDKCIPVTGGWMCTAIPLSTQYPNGYHGEPVVTYNDSSVKVAGQGNKHGYWHTIKMVDLSKYDTLTFVTTGGSTTGNSILYVKVRSSLSGYKDTNNVAETKLSVSGATTLDISSVSGAYYVGISIYSDANVTVTQIYME